MVGDGHLEVDELPLTGELNLVTKHEGDMLYSGTFCVPGVPRIAQKKWVYIV